LNLYCVIVTSEIKINPNVDSAVQKKSGSEQAEPLRLGRRESEPHSKEVSYLYQILSDNLPNCRIFWDLHHYFPGRTLDSKLDLQFDISLFKDLNEPHELSSYKSEEYDNRVPDLVINVLSASTWEKDIISIPNDCLFLKIPLYIIFAPYHVASNLYMPPFLRIYSLNDLGFYNEITLRKLASKEGEHTIEFSNLYDLRPILPLLMGLQERQTLHKSGGKRYQIIFVDPQTREVLKNKEEKRADEEKKRADKYLELLRKNKINMDFE